MGRRTGRKGQSHQLCWRCARATGLCPWSASFTPVAGWTATPTVYEDGRGADRIEVRSWNVKACPLYRKDR